MRRAVLVGLCMAAMFCLFASTYTTPARAQEPDADAVLDQARDALNRSDLDFEHQEQLRLFVMINEYRVANGLYPLELDARLNAAAWDHSVDMADHGYCRHGGTDGTDARRRMAAHGYPYDNWAGENIVCGKASPEAALAWWKNSAPHRRNLLHGHFTHIGVAMAPNGPWGPMWTLDFADGAPDTVTPIVFNTTPRATGRP